MIKTGIIFSKSIRTMKNVSMKANVILEDFSMKLMIRISNKIPQNVIDV